MPKENNSIIKVIGVGGGGSNAVNHMYRLGIKGVDFIVCNTDRQALDVSPVPYKIQLGPSLTEGRGAGSLPEIGKNAAIENIEEIRNLLEKDTKMVFITAGMGGGTGTGAAPVIAEVARELGILTVGIVTVPFNFEGRKRRQQAEDGLEAIRSSVDTLLTINNEKLREMSGNLSISNAFAQADDILSVAAKGIADVISFTGAINVDFNDVNTVMRDSGAAIMGSATAEGENRAIAAVEKALASPLLNENDIAGANYVLLNITYGTDEILMDEISDITDYIQQEAGSTADVIWGYGQDESLGDAIGVTIIATGFKTSPFTGFDKAPEKKVTTLDEEPKNEIKAPLSSPTQVNTWDKAKEIETIQEEPVLIKKEEFEDKTSLVEDSTLSFDTPSVDSGDQKAMNFDWELKPENATELRSDDKEEVKRYVLDDELESTVELGEVSNTKSVLSPEEQQKRNHERMSKIQEYTAKLKKAEGITELESEPAFVRRNIQIENVKYSSEENISRFGLTEGENGGAELRGNSFLHDNVD